MEKSVLVQAIPQLPSGDIEKTGGFFEKYLGFEVVAKMNGNTFMIVRRGGVEIHFWKTATEEEAKKLGINNSCYIRVQNIENLFEEFKKRGATFRYPLTKQPWGMHEMQIDDPYLNAIRFGEAIL